jgi:hypothetical protein
MTVSCPIPPGRCDLGEGGDAHKAKQKTAQLIR